MRRMLFGVLLLGLVLGGEALSQSGQVLTVEVKTAKLMEKPGYLGKTTGAVNRGERLTVRSLQSGWYQVMTGRGVTGWINQKSVATPGRASLSSAGQSGTGTSESEVALAGRGFSKDVEAQYRKENSTLDYSHIDAIETAEPDLAAVLMFATQGGLRGGK